VEIHLHTHRHQTGLVLLPLIFVHLVNTHQPNVLFHNAPDDESELRLFAIYVCMLAAPGGVMECLSVVA
jgi:hypothetical protein